MRQSGITNIAPWSAAPTVGPAGDTYFDTTLKQTFISDGSLWLPMSGSVSSFTNPRGLIANGSSITAPAAGAKLPMDTVVYGAASWVTNSRVLLPTGSAGLYLITFQVQYTSPTVIAVGFELCDAAGGSKTPFAHRAGGMVSPGNPVNNIHGTWLRQCIDGESFAVFNYQNPITSGNARLFSFSMLRVGDALSTS